MTALRRLQRQARQRGAALLMAMLTVTLVAGFAAAALWQQWQAVEVESAERSRVQGAWILTGSLDWARLILREDGRSGGADYLGEPWAVALQESRLSSFLAAGQSTAATDSTDDDLDVFLSGQIEDMQGRLNVANLADGAKVSEPDLLAFSRLFELLGLPEGELTTLAASLARAAPGGAVPVSAAAPLMPQRLPQLQWLGLSKNSLDILKPYITLLPARTPVNLNTASAEVIYASVPGLDLAQAQRLVDQRALNYFRNVGDADKLIGEPAGRINQSAHSVQTRFFEVRGRLRMDSTLIEERSLVQRDGLDVRTLWRERAALPPVVDSANAANAGASMGSLSR